MSARSTNQMAQRKNQKKSTQKKLGDRSKGIAASDPERFVYSNLAITLDGKIAPTGRSFCPLGTAEDLRLLEELRGDADVVLFGASTLRTFKKPCQAKLTRRHAKYTPKVLGKNGAPRQWTAQPANAVVSSQLEGIDPKWPFFRDPTLRRVLLVSSSCPPARRAKFAKTCEIIVLPKSDRKGSATQWLNALAELGLKRVLVEGGGGTMWEFVKQNLIDQYYVTLTPRILGGAQAPTLVDGEGFDASQILDLKLLQARRMGDELYLIYTKKR